MTITLALYPPTTSRERCRWIGRSWDDAVELVDGLGLLRSTSKGQEGIPYHIMLSIEMYIHASRGEKERDG